VDFPRSGCPNRIACAVPSRGLSQNRLRPYFPPFKSGILEERVDTEVQVFGGKIFALTWDRTLQPRPPAAHDSQEPLGIQRITRVRYRTHRMETTQDPQYHSRTPITGHSGPEQRRDVQRHSRGWHGFTWLRNKTPPFWCWVMGEKSHSRADNISFNLSQQVAGVATGRLIGGPGFDACDVQPWSGRLLLHLKSFLEQPTDHLHHL
jgi:hypothetical protein